MPSNREGLRRLRIGATFHGPFVGVTREGTDCSGLPGHSSESTAASIPAAPRLPYGFRWNEYQGADIEHDIYGDRRSVSTARTVPHTHPSPVMARVFGGLFAAPVCRTCV